MANRLAKALAALSVLLPLLSVAAPRLISLSPANTELAFAAGITPVGVSSHSDYPAQARKVEQVANWQGINLERIIALKPDLVLAWRGGSPVRQVQQLSAMGIRVLWVDTVTIEQVADVLRQLAPWSPAPEKARQAAQALLSEYAILKARYAGRAKKRVFLQLSSSPLFTSGKGSIQNQVIELCAGENIFASARVPWPQVSREQVLTRRPQAIIVTGGADKMTEAERFWNNQLKIPIIPLNRDWLERAGPRIILAAKQLCSTLSQLDSD